MIGKFEITLFGAMGLVVIILFMALFGLKKNYDGRINQLNEICEQHDGVYLKNTWYTGKTQQSSFLCLKKNSVIELSK